MNRVIKFRAMCEADGVYRMVYLEVQQFDNGLIAWPAPNNISHIGEYTSPLMQFTGLHDKNSKEIYEGDIVRFWTQSTKNKKGGIISVVTIEHGLLIPFYDPTYTEDEQGDWFISEKGFEVIGNIHETPTLLP